MKTVNRKKWKRSLNVFIVSTFFFASCNTLDVPPPNIITDEDIFPSEEGVTAYLARMYRDMPIVEFYGGRRAGEGAAPDEYTGEFVECPASATRKIANSSLQFYGGHYDAGIKELQRVWNYTPIRLQNYFLQEIGNYEGRPHTADRIKELKAHAYWMRAFRYFEMVKRYGGVPIIDEVTNYPEQSIEDLKRPRNNERDCYDFILADCDRAIENFSSDPASRKAGYANKWDAYALKSRVALYAASIAKYGPIYSGGHLYKDGLTGVVSDSAAYYYRVAYEAAEEVVKSNLYELYTAKWQAGNYEAIKENFSAIFYDRSSKEAMFALQYLQLLSTAVFDANNLPYQVGTKYSGKLSPTLEFVELYEYADPALLSTALKSKSGERFRLGTDLTGTDAAPKFYSSPLDVFEGIEPRLAGSITLPGSEIRDQVIDIRYGIMPAGHSSYSQAALQHTASYDQEYNGMKVQGLSGMGADDATSTGFYNRKWFDPDLSEDYIKDTSHGTVVPWQEFRYAEVLLNIAEAVTELKALGETVTPAMSQEAADHIQKIRQRAGAKADKYNASNLTVEAVRMERRKEFYMENKTFWDLRRWRIAHEEMNEKQWNLIQPVFFWNQQKYYVRRDSIDFSYRQTFQMRQYYFDIPGFAKNANSALINNPSQNF